MFQLIRKTWQRLVGLWRRIKGRATTKALSGQIGLTGRLIAHNLPRKIGEKVSIGEGVVAVVKGEHAEAIRISDSAGQSTSADLHADDSVDFLIRGKSRQGENGIVQVCQVLIERLNRNGYSWEEPVDVANDPKRREEGIDCEAHNGEKILRIQVTRVERDQSFWQELAISQEATKISTVDISVGAIRDAIETKARFISPFQRRELVLALDATETASYAFKSVVDLFRERYGQWAATLGFEGVWIVGPTVGLTSRLDEFSSGAEL